MRSCRRLPLAAFALVALAAPSARAQTPTPAWGRFSLFFQGSRSVQDAGTSSNLSDLIGNLTLQSAGNDDGGFEYALDVRGSNYSGSFSQQQTSIYNAFAGVRSAGGTLGLRLGQMWINDLGALGAVGGTLLEDRARPSALGRFRLDLFGGVEPDPFQPKFVQGVRKFGGYVALDGDLGRRSVLGYVTIRNQGMTEREVVTMLNLLPVGRKFFLYQAAEYDLVGPAGTHKPGLNYFFTNFRWAPSDVVDLEGTYHHGLSIDARTITNDELQGKPVDSRLLTGFLFESAGGRLTVTLLPRVRVWAGYYRDRNSVDTSPTGRVNAGLWAGNILGTGLDVMVSDNRWDRPENHFDSWYLSLGASLGRAVYLSADYTTSLSILSFTGAGGVTVESRPQTRRYALSSTINLSRTLSLIFTAERLLEDTGHEDRAMGGFVVRF